MLARSRSFWSVIAHSQLRRPYVYVLSESRIYYRHLVRGPWYLVRTHGAEISLPARTDTHRNGEISQVINQHKRIDENA
jgi:hypothetical protein